MDSYTLQPLWFGNHSFKNYILEQAVAETVLTIHSFGPKYDDEGNTSDGSRVQPVLTVPHIHTIQPHEPLRGHAPYWRHKTLFD